MRTLQEIERIKLHRKSLAVKRPIVKKCRVRLYAPYILHSRGVEEAAVVGEVIEKQDVCLVVKP
ncbi:MAG: hypothetical protein QMD05_02780 [Candidatus Brocadiaceae bacterium]|nr:hypothetical protein [Candidatus Brocadiaceae bacterium]